MKIKNLFCAGMAGVMLANTSVFCASADKIPTDDPRYYNWSYPEDYEDQPHIVAYSSYCYKDSGYTISLHHIAKEPENYDYTTDGYDFKVQMKINGKWKNICSGKSNNVSYGWNGGTYIENLKPYSTYTVRICIPHYTDFFNNKEGFKAYSEAVKVRTIPAQTAVTSTSSSKNAVRLSWKKVKCQGYKIQRNMGGNLWKTVKTVRNSDTTTARISKLRPGKKYRFRVRAYGKTLDKFPVTKIGEGIDDENYLTHNLWGKPSKVVTIKTKK
jgi:hypothetical protein